MVKDLEVGRGHRPQSPWLPIPRAREATESRPPVVAAAEAAGVMPPMRV
jgi:hypothetical protein